MQNLKSVLLVSAALASASAMKIASGQTSAQPKLETRAAPLLKVNDLTFKDLNRNGVLDPYEDWRLPIDKRVADLLSKMTLEEKAGLMRITYLTDPALRQRYAQVKRELPVVPVVALAPMKNRGEVLVIRCWDYSVKVQKRKLILGVLGGRDVEFRFDCTAGRYVIARVNKWAFRVD